MRKQRSPRPGPPLAAGILALGAVDAAPAAVIFLNADSGAYNFATNWSPHQIPGAADGAIFARGAGITYITSFPGNLIGGFNRLAVNAGAIETFHHLPGSNPPSTLPQRASVPSGSLGIETSGDTILRRLRAAPPTQGHAGRVIGIDDFAFRRGQHYGTIVVDHESGDVIDLLPDRTSASRKGDHRRGGLPGDPNSPR